MTRPAEEKDLSKILKIYNYYVKNTTYSFDTKIRDITKGKVWFHNHDSNHPIIVDESDPIRGKNCFQI